ncbi:cuticle protein 8-like [Colias croceus]|uniref:cuticle protein 8-like n=1 Tax=Colias crocea TaxID=72248 RepID=UPI001E27E372|nr:cuticle protein 8-like [Colias croceus]
MRVRTATHVLLYTQRPHAIVMYAKFFIVCCVCAVASAAPGYLDTIGYAAPAIHAAPIAHTIAAPAVAHVVRAEPVDPNPAYTYSYGVNDPHTGDHKDAQETLQNGVVHGSYSLVEPDGHLRKVTYTADHVNGFNAVVERTGNAHPAPAVAVAHAPVAVASAPIAVAHAPVAVSAPIGHPWR